MERTKFDNNISTIRELGDLLEQIFDVAKGGYQELKNVTFYKAYPSGTKPDDLIHPCITYGIKRKTPMVNPKGLTARTSEEDLRTSTRVSSGNLGGYRRPQQMEEFPDPENEGHTITISMQRHVYNIRFDVWTTSNEVADIITEEFEEFMHTYTGILMNRGISKLIYAGTESDEIMDWKDELIHRIIKFEVIMENIYVTSSKNIEEVLTQVTPKENLN